MAKGKTLARLEEYGERVKRMRGRFLGYPENQNMQYGDLLHNFGLFEACIDNVGDPFSDSLYKINSFEFEKEVIGFFAKMYDLDEYWGYVTACGTEGNICGVYAGRNLYPNGILYYSKDSHYSIAKAAKLLRLEERVIGSLENGEMDYADFASKIDASKPAIINANIGTTMKGAIDNLDQIEDVLIKKGVTEYYIHCDAALSGMLLPFLKNAPSLSFRKNIGSISISGHKFIGTPLPCGIFLTRAGSVQKNHAYVEYAGIEDNTIMGSRSGLAPIFLWYAIQEKGLDGFRSEARECVANAEYLYRKLQDMNYPSWLNGFSNTVYFKKPSENLASEWQLAKQGDFAHVVTMQHATRERLDAFVEELKREWL